MEEVKPDNSLPENEFAFIIIKDLNGNLGIKPLQEGAPLTTDQIYQSCHTICRNIEAQDVASAVAMQMVQAAQGMSKTDKGLVVPSHIKRVK